MPRELLFSITKKDFEMQTFRSGGKGGQHQNKTDSGVRLIHKASGARGESRTHRSQNQNKREALRRLVASPRFKIWHAGVVAEMNGRPSLDSVVDDLMKSENLLIESKGEDGKWHPASA